MSLKTSVGEIISQLRIKTLKSLTQNSFFTDPKTKSCFLLKNVKKENHHHHGASTNCCTANQQLSTAAPMERCVSKEVPFASFSKVSYCKEELTATTPVDCAAISQQTNSAAIYTQRQTPSHARSYLLHDLLLLQDKGR